MTQISSLSFDLDGIFWKRILRYFSEQQRKIIKKILIMQSIAFHSKNSALPLSMRLASRYLIGSEIMKISHMRLSRKSKENETEEIRKYRIILSSEIIFSISELWNMLSGKIKPFVNT